MPTDFWNPGYLASLVGGVWVGEAPSAAVRATGVGIDTRTLGRGEVYVAIAGENHDGHDFVAQALDAGAAFAVVEEGARFSAGVLSGDLPGGFSGALPGVLRVKSGVEALRVWASAWRDALAAGGCEVIAVAGSNGKTTTRHLIHHVLTACGETGTQSLKSFNNHLGVPLTLLAAKAADDFVACEVGTNHPGEVAALSAVVRPDAAVITSIGAEHLEFFGDLEGVAEEEAALLPWVKPGGVVFVEAAAAERIAPYYDVQEGVAMLPVKAGAYGEVIPEDFPMLGRHNRSNAALALVVGRWRGLGDGAMREALRGAVSPAGRMELLRFGGEARGRRSPGFGDGDGDGGGVVVIHDAYNANPDSVRLALEALAQHGGGVGWEGRRVAVMGDMLELGGQARAAHEAAAAHAQRVAEVCWYVGEHFARARPWSAVYGEEVVASLRAGDVVLLKGSRSVGLERILPLIAARFGAS